MITFCVILVAFFMIALLATGGILVAGAALGGALLVALDVVIGLAPFVGAGFLIAWLVKKRG